MRGRQPGTTFHRCFAPYPGTSPGGGAVNRDVSQSPPAASLSQELLAPHALSRLLNQSQKLAFSASSDSSLVALCSSLPHSPSSLSRRVIELPKKNLGGCWCPSDSVPLFPFPKELGPLLPPKACLLPFPLHYLCQFPQPLIVPPSIPALG